MQATIDLCLSSGGTNLPFHIGFLEGLEISGIKIERISGVSAGCIVAGLYAHGVSCKRMTELVKENLNPGALDLFLLPFMFGSTALAKGEKLKEVGEALNLGLMGDAEMTWGGIAVDLERRMPVTFRSDRDPHLPSVDVMRASASIPFLFQPARIRGSRGLFIDGAVSVGLGMSIWDDVPERETVGVRFKSEAGTRRPVNGSLEKAQAIMETLLENAERAHISAKVYQRVVDIETGRGSLNFLATEEDVDLMIKSGRDQALEWAFERLEASG